MKKALKRSYPAAENPLQLKHFLDSMHVSCKKEEEFANVIEFYSNLGYHVAKQSADEHGHVGVNITSRSKMKHVYCCNKIHVHASYRKLSFAEWKKWIDDNGRLFTSVKLGIL